MLNKMSLIAGVMCIAISVTSAKDKNLGEFLWFLFLGVLNLSLTD